MFEFVLLSVVILIFELMCSLVLDETFSTYSDSSSPDGAQQSTVAPKNIVSERNRRKKLTDRLHALRAVVPNISKVYTQFMRNLYCDHLASGLVPTSDILISECDILVMFN